MSRSIGGHSAPRQRTNADAPQRTHHAVMPGLAVDA